MRRTVGAEAHSAANGRQAEGEDPVEGEGAAAASTAAPPPHLRRSWRTCYLMGEELLCHLPHWSPSSNRRRRSIPACCYGTSWCLQPFNIGRYWGGEEHAD